MIIIRNVRPREKIRKDIQLFLLNVQPSVLTQDLFILLYSASLFIILWCNSSSIKRGQACFLCLPVDLACNLQIPSLQFYCKF